MFTVYVSAGAGPEPGHRAGVMLSVFHNILIPWDLPRNWTAAAAGGAAGDTLQKHQLSK